MSVRVIIPPEPIFTSQDLIGSTDASVDALIAAVVEELDGPEGWLGRAIGPQTLELSLDRWCERHIRLPYPPIISVVSVTYLDTTGVLQTVDPGNYEVSDEILWFRGAWAFPQVGLAPHPVRIRYEAGYDGEDVAGGGTGVIPARIKQAVTLSLQHLRAIGGDDLFLQLDVVEGIGRKQYVVSEVAGQIIQDAADRLLSGLRRYA